MAEASDAYSVAEAAERMGVSAGYVRLLVRRGTLPIARRIDKRTYLIDGESVDTFQWRPERPGRPRLRPPVRRVSKG